MKAKSSTNVCSVYVRKALNVNLPQTEDKHYLKNPFNRFLRANTLRPKLVSSMQYLLPQSQPTLRSRTMAPQAEKASSHPKPEQTKKPEAHLNESAFSSSWLAESDEEAATSGDEVSPEESKEQVQEEVEEAEKVSSNFEVKLSKEVAFNFARLSLINPVTSEEVYLKQITLPDAHKTHKKTLILDMDDTLIHTINGEIDYRELGVAHKDIKTTFYEDPSIGTLCISFVIRPYAIKFLKEMSRLYEIIVILSLSSLN